MGEDRQVRPLHRRPQIGVGGRPAHAVLHRHVEPAEPLLPLPVEVGADGVAGLPSGLDEGLVERARFQAARRRERPVAPPPGVAAAAKALRAAKVGKDIRIRPAFGALLLPSLEIERVPADVDEAVDRRRAAEHFSAGAIDPAAAEMRLGLGAIAPVVGARIHRQRQRRRHLDDQRPIGPAVFEREHGRSPVLGQSIGQHAAGRAGADDDVVEGLLAHGRRFAPNGAHAASAILTRRCPEIWRRSEWPRA